MRVRYAVLVRPAFLLSACLFSMGAGCEGSLDPALITDCDDDAGFRLDADRQALTVAGVNPSSLTITIERTGEFGEINFDLQPGVRVYGGAGLEEMGVQALFLPNPAPANGTAVTLQAMLIGADNLPDLSDHAVFVRGFAGAGNTAKECFMGVTITTTR